MHLLRCARLAGSAALIVMTIAACSGSGSTEGGVDSSGNVVNVTASEFKFDPSSVSVPAGTVTFHVRNGGQAEHEFEIIKGEAELGEIEGLVPGLEKDLKVDLGAGILSYVCRLPGHEQQGMKGSLTVTP